METNINYPICKSVFKDGKVAPKKEEFTLIWINLINRIERSKNFAQK